MNSFDIKFKEILSTIIQDGFEQENRTGINAIILPATFLQHDMRDGFPISTLRKMPFKPACVELEGFIKGITSKKWFQERGCPWWNSWCSPDKVKYSTDPEVQEKMRLEDDLGLIYGSQWRDFHDPVSRQYGEGDYNCVDQFRKLITTIKTDPNDRRMIVMSWNPLALNYQALPACHTGFMVNVINGRLNLSYTMRSCDFLIGNALVTYGLLLHLLAKESGLEEGVLSAFWHSPHIYNNQIQQVETVLNREPYKLPSIVTRDFTNIFDWTHDQTMLVNYQAHDRINVEVAI